MIMNRTLACLFLLFAMIFFLNASDEGGAFETVSDQAAKAPESSAPGNRTIETVQKGLPLFFLPNQGQTDSRVRFLVRAGGQTAYLTDTGIVFDSTFFERERDSRNRTDRIRPEERKGKRLVWSLDFEGADPAPRISGESKASAKFHYLIGNDSSKWVTDVPAYQTVVYHDLYPGIDLKLYGTRGRLEYDLVVSPGADLDQVSLACRGLEELSIQDGELVAATALGEIRQTRPNIYQEREGAKEEVGGGFNLLAGNRYAFEVDDYDASRPLVIDPALVTLPYSTYLGGGGNDRGCDIDGYLNFVFVTGTTGSSDFPTTTGVLNTEYNSGDAFVAKINPNLSGALSLVWCTFIGGSSSEEGCGIVAQNDSPYVCGMTFSDDFPLVNNGYLVRKGNNDGFVAQLNSMGTGFLFSVLFGSGAYDECLDIDVMGNTAWVCGVTTSGEYLYPTFENRHSYGYTTYPSYGDAFIIGIAFNVTPVIMSQVIVMGGSARDTARGIAVDTDGIYIIGDTMSSDFITTPGAYDSTFSGGTIQNSDVFLAKFNLGGVMAFSTFFGNSTDSDRGNGVCLGQTGVYICGDTGGWFPIVNGYDSSDTHAHHLSGFMAKVNYDGTDILYSTYIESNDSNGATSAKAIRTQGASDCWVAGETDYALAGIDSKNYYQLEQGYDDAFVVRINTTATAGSDSLVFGTHLGGDQIPGQPNTGLDYALGVYGADHHVYITGYTTSQNFPTANAYQSALAGGEDAFVAHLVEPLPAVTTDAASLVYSSSANLNGTVTSKSGAPYVNASFEWGTTSGDPYLNTTSPSESVTSIPTSYSKILTGLTPGATYYYRAVGYHYLYAYVYGAERNFTTPAALAPTVTTAGPLNITGTTAQCGGEVTSSGSDPVLERGVCWNTGGTPTTADPHTSDGAGTGSFTSNITGLTPNTGYWVRAYATNAIGTSYGANAPFSTDDYPTVTTAVVTNVTGSTAQSGGNVTDNGGDTVTARGVCWNTTGSPTTADSHTTNGSGTGSFTSNLTGLSPNTSYFVRAYATNGVGTAYGGQETFTTDNYPTVTTAAVTNITGSTATSGGNVTSDGGELVTARGVCWNTTGNPTLADAHSTETGGTGTFTSNLTGLTPGTLYYVRAYATNSVGTSYGGQESFTTDTLPTVTTGPMTDIHGRSADGGGEVTSDGGEPVTARGVCWSVASNPTIYDSHTTDGTGVGTFTSHLTGLMPGRLFYVRAYAANSVGTAYGAEITFTTDTTATVTTTTVTNIGSSTADSGGNIPSDGGEPVTSRGVCWSTIGYPTVDSDHTSDGTGTGSFTSYVTGLTPGRTYYLRAYAVNSVGEAYGARLSFTTLPEVPVAQPASAIGATSFQTNWSAAAGAAGYLLDVALDSAFSSILPAYNSLDVGNVTAYPVTGLSPGTPYFYRLRAYNSMGGTTADSNTIGLTTLNIHTVLFTSSDGGTLSGNLSQTVVHGTDCTPVTANPDTGFRFIDWSGTGGFWSTANPLTVTDVQADMTINAQFANAAPSVRIISPAAGATVWGAVDVQAEAVDDSDVERVDFYVDGVPAQSAGPAGLQTARAGDLYSFIWSALNYANGPHVIRAVAVDAAGATSMDQITVDLQNVSLSLSGQRMEDRAWIIRREFARLNMAAVNSGDAPVARYIITRRTGGGPEETIASIDASEVQGGATEYNDATLPEGGVCTYRVVAVTAENMVVGLSNELTL